MTRKGKATNDQRVRGVINGVLITAVFSVILCAIFSLLLVKGMLREEWIDYTGIIIMLISSYAGSNAALKNTEGKGKWLALVTGGIFLLILGLVHIMIFHGKMNNLLMISTSVLAGSGISILLIKEKKGKRMRKSFSHYR